MEASANWVKVGMFGEENKQIRPSLQFGNFLHCTSSATKLYNQTKRKNQRFRICSWNDYSKFMNVTLDKCYLKTRKKLQKLRSTFTYFALWHHSRPGWSSDLCFFVGQLRSISTQNSLGIRRRKWWPQRFNNLDLTKKIEINYGEE